VGAATEFITPQRSTTMLSEYFKKVYDDKYSMHTKRKLLDKNDFPN